MVSRRSFVKALSLGALSLPLLTSQFSKAWAAQEKEPGRHALIWMKGHAPNLHSNALWSHPDLLRFMERHVDTRDLSVLNGELVQMAAAEQPVDFILIEGHFPADLSKEQMQAVYKLINQARLVILLGNESCYTDQAPDGYLAIEKDLVPKVRTPLLKIPGLPAQPSHLLGTLNHLLLYGMPELDEHRRPKLFFEKTICHQCEFRMDFEAGNFINYLGEREGCLYQLGCKGPVTKNTCPTQGLTNSRTWCVAVGSPCSGCSEPGYPLHQGLGLFGQVRGDKAGVNSFVVKNAEEIALGTLGVALTGIGLHAVSKKTLDPVKIHRLDDQDEEE